MVLYPFANKKVTSDRRKTKEKSEKARYDLLVSPMTNSVFSTMKINAGLSAIACYIVALSTSGFLQILK